MGGGSAVFDDFPDLGHRPNASASTRASPTAALEAILERMLLLAGVDSHTCADAGSSTRDNCVPGGGTSPSSEAQPSSSSMPGHSSSGSSHAWIPEDPMEAETVVMASIRACAQAVRSSRRMEDWRSKGWGTDVDADSSWRLDEVVKRLAALG